MYIEKAIGTVAPVLWELFEYVVYHFTAVYNVTIYISWRHYWHNLLRMALLNTFSAIWLGAKLLADWTISAQSGWWYVVNHRSQCWRVGTWTGCPENGWRFVYNGVPVKSTRGGQTYCITYQLNWILMRQVLTNLVYCNTHYSYRHYRRVVRVTVYQIGK
jgi:hypothetical protein